MEGRKAVQQGERAGLLSRGVESRAVESGEGMESRIVEGLEEQSY